MNTNPNTVDESTIKFNKPKVDNTNENTAEGALTRSSEIKFSFDNNH